MTTTITVDYENAMSTPPAWGGGNATEATELLPEGAFLVGPVLPRVIPQEEAFFWTPEWQAGEAAADAEIASGQAYTFDSMDDAIRFLLRDR